MIIIKVLENKINVTGHAKGGYNNKNESLPCCAISILTQTMYHYINNNNDLKNEIEVNNLEIDTTNNKELREYLIFSLKLIEKEFPKEIEIIE